MTVTWLSNRGKNWPEAGYAIPCPTCNVEIGRPCLTRKTHLARNERAEVFGFVVAEEDAGAEAVPDLLRIMEAAE